MTQKDSVKVRMYRLDELGDCFLSTFTVGGKESHLLIDCGSFRNSGASITRLGQVVDQIKQDLGGASLDVVVGTHQHNDHLNGFLHHKTAFEGIGVKQVWLSWLDDPRDRTARKIGQDHNNLRMHLHQALVGLNESMPANSRQRATRSLGVLEDMLGFFGATKDRAQPPEVPAKAVEVLKKLGEASPRYLKPGQVLDLPGLPADSVRVHVLGPPRDHASLYRKDPRDGESYDPKLTNAVRMAEALFRATANNGGDAKAEKEQYPFNRQLKCRGDGASDALKEVQRRYRANGEHWRTIDHDWMQQAENLALYLNDFTNNSSLVLAIELVKTGRVLLFAADAQTGNWASWDSIEWEAGHPGTASLMQRTLLYKVGHHSSHNATYVPAFERMGGDDLCAIIPVNKSDPNITKPNGWKMPAAKLFKRLVERTNGRVLQMDNVNPASCRLSDPEVKAAWKKAGITPKVTPMAIELNIPM